MIKTNPSVENGDWAVQHVSDPQKPLACTYSSAARLIDFLKP